MPQKPSATATKPKLATRQKNAEIAAISARLLGHYWTGEELAAVRQAQIEDWVEDLHEFPIARVAEACREYRTGPVRSHRPIPGDIRALCIAAEIAERERIAVKQLDGPINLDAWARSLGWSSWLERQDAIAANEMRYAVGAYGIRRWASRHRPPAPSP